VKSHDRSGFVQNKGLASLRMRTAAASVNTSSWPAIRGAVAHVFPAEHGCREFPMRRRRGFVLPGMVEWLRPAIG
jgi:hypothetical protein